MLPNLISWLNNIFQITNYQVSLSLCTHLNNFYFYNTLFHLCFAIHSNFILKTLSGLIQTNTQIDIFIVVLLFVC